MSPMRLGYRELGVEIVYLEEKYYRTPKQPSMVEEKRDNKTRYPFKLFLKESRTRRRNEMMDNFSQILRWLLETTEPPLTNNKFEGAMPFKVQFKFDIPVFEG
jgi:hypothetical protein